MPRKLDYGQEKLQDIMDLLAKLGLEYSKNKDSLDISVKTKEDKRRLTHELHKIFILHKSPPLTTQFDATSQILSIFDQRV